MMVVIDFHSRKKIPWKSIAINHDANLTFKKNVMLYIKSTLLPKKVRCSFKS